MPKSRSAARTPACTDTKNRCEVALGTTAISFLVRCWQDASERAANSSTIRSSGLDDRTKAQYTSRRGRLELPEGFYVVIPDFLVGCDNREAFILRLRDQQSVKWIFMQDWQCSENGQMLGHHGKQRPRRIVNDLIESVVETSLQQQFAYLDRKSVV